jgi:hypothetical protein
MGVYSKDKLKIKLSLYLTDLCRSSKHGDRKELYMDKYSEEEISIGTDGDILPCNQEPSSKLEDRKYCMEEEPDSSKWHTRRNRICVLPCHSLICHLEQHPQILYVIPPPGIMKLLLTDLLMMILVQ